MLAPVSFHPDALTLLTQNAIGLLALGWLFDRAMPRLAAREGGQEPAALGLIFGAFSSVPAMLPLAVVPETAMSLQPAIVLAAAALGGLWAALAAAAAAIATATVLALPGAPAMIFGVAVAAALGTALFV